MNNILNIGNNKEKTEDINILLDVSRRISDSKPLPAQFARIIEEDFWDLLF